MFSFRDSAQFLTVAKLYPFHNNIHDMTQSSLEYSRNLPSKRMAAGVLFFNSAGEVLLVEPTYKNTWEIPGGVIELNESPADAAVREVNEELGIIIEKDSLKLACVEYMAASHELTEALMFVFIAKELTERQLDSVTLRTEEIKSCRYVASKEVFALLGKVLGTRIEKCIAAEGFIYSESSYTG